MTLISSLNPAQNEAVTTTQGPVLVLAGAGTGKTRVITVRMAYLLQQGVAPEQILAMTFTNKAAREMRSRVIDIVGKQRGKKLFVGTFHSFCIELLRTHGDKIGIPNFTISDGSDQLSMLRKILREVSVGEVTMKPGQALARISLLKNKLQDNANYLAEAKDDEDELVARVWERYDAQLRRSRALDFDDILLYALKILQLDGPARDYYRNQYKYVMVDEYQDTNGPQYEIVRAIASGHRNLCVVGDDDQSIYGWRGADISKILGFETDFPGAAVIKMETNYRSTAPILKAANRVIRNNPNRHEKTLRSHHGEGLPLSLVIAEDETEEADHVAREIQDLVRDTASKLSDMAILFRTGPQARVFEQVLRTRNIPYVLIGGMSFFDRKEVRDVVSYLKLVVNPDEEMALLRVINCPPRGVGKTSIDRILQFSTNEEISISDAFQRCAEIEGVTDAAIVAVDELFKVLETLRNQKGSLVGRVSALIEAVSYKTEVERNYPDELTRQQRWTAVEEVMNFAENHARKKKNANIESFLQDLALSADDRPEPEGKEKRNRVTLMTLHAAKGLEYQRVYLVGLEEGLLPHARSVAEDTVEEERRLAYVGITRAKRVLTLSLTKTRARGGHRIQTMPSRFLFELKDEKPPADWRPAGSAPEPKRKAKKSKRRGAVRAKTSYR